MVPSSLLRQSGATVSVLSPRVASVDSRLPSLTLRPSSLLQQVGEAVGGEFDDALLFGLARW